jgi:hypothetical protein
MMSWRLGRRSRKSVVMVKARVHTRDQFPIVPILIPELNEVREFAAKLHVEGRPWRGEAFGWPAEYNPESSEPPLDSQMTFTLADFSIGESGIWFYSLMWEHEKEKEPVEFLDDRNIIR